MPDTTEISLEPLFFKFSSFLSYDIVLSLEDPFSNLVEKCVQPVLLLASKKSNFKNLASSIANRNQESQCKNNRVSFVSLGKHVGIKRQRCDNRVAAGLEQLQPDRA